MGKGQTDGESEQNVTKELFRVHDSKFCIFHDFYETNIIIIIIITLYAVEDFIVMCISLLSYVIPHTNLGQKEKSVFSYRKFHEYSEKLLPQA